MKNHYVPQLIIRRFAETVNVYDKSTREVKTEQKPENIFFKEDIYSEEIEKRLAHELEGPMAQLIDGEIREKSAIRLTRRQSFLLRRYLLLDSVRMRPPEEFALFLERFAGSATAYFQLSFTPCNLPATESLNLEPKALLMRAMELYLDCQTANDILVHPLATRELYCWALPFLEGYLAFWDSAKGQQFFLSSTGMTSEYEPSHTVFYGADGSKRAYLYDRFVNSPVPEEKLFYASLLNLTTVMYENFDIFNLTATRCAVIVNPFFRLYAPAGKVKKINGVDIDPPKPDIWSTCFQTRELVNVPAVSPIADGKFSDDDIFEYTPVALSLYDTVYMNYLFYNESDSLVGYGDIGSVRNSLWCINLLNAYSDGASPDLICRLAQEHSSAGLLDYYADSLSKPDFYLAKFRDHYKNMAFADIVGNKYFLKHLLEHADDVVAMDNFRFFGAPEERLKNIRKALSALESQKSPK